MFGLVFLTDVKPINDSFRKRVIIFLLRKKKKKKVFSFSRKLFGGSRIFPLSPKKELTEFILYHL